RPIPKDPGRPRPAGSDRAIAHGRRDPSAQPDFEHRIARSTETCPPNQRKFADMKHPSTEEWMSFLYEENSPRQRTELKAHLRSCPECCVKVAEWRAGMRALDQTLGDCRRPAAVQ